MNFLSVCRQLGLLILVTSAVILLLAAWSALQSMLGDESETVPARALLMTVAIGGLLGAALWLGGRRFAGEIGRREAILLVAMSWFVAAAIGAMPYRFWAALSVEDRLTTPFGDYINCYFEAMSGLTTTGPRCSSTSTPYSTRS